MTWEEKAREYAAIAFIIFCCVIMPVLPIYILYRIITPDIKTDVPDAGVGCVCKLEK